MVSRVEDRPPDFEDRWKEPQHGNVNRNGRFAPGPVAPSHESGAGAGSWTSEDEVQVTEDAPRPGEYPGWEQHRTAETAGPVGRLASRLVPARGA